MVFDAATRALEPTVEVGDVRLKPLGTDDKGHPILFP
jgi:hypothetical protein